MKLADLLYSDPTLEAADRALEAKAAEEKSRTYLGASSIGHPCSRKLWYGMRPEIPKKPMDAASLKRFADGFHGENVVIERLRAVEGVEIWNQDEDGGQIGGTLFDGKFGWHVDGVILGVHAAPKTYHVLEVKIVNETKFNKLKKLKADYGEKMALAQWDKIYYAQAMVYCELLEMTRHYLVVATPGVRDWVSCRTDENKPMAKGLLNKAERIIKATSEPERLSNDPSFFECKWCDYRDVCHEK